LEKICGRQFSFPYFSKISREGKYWEKIEEEQRKNKQDHQKANLKVMKLLVPAYVYNPKFIPQLEKDLPNPKVSNARVNHLVWRSSEKSYDLKGAFKNFKAPVLILAGRQDILGEEVPLTLNKEIPNSSLHFINECSHYPWLDQPEEYFTAIKEFVK
jgi:proline iminopeptidase